MKKIYFLLTVIAMAFASCDPLSNTYKDLNANPSAQIITFGSTTSYASLDLAKTGISALLNTKYGDYPNNTRAIVSTPLLGTFTLAASTVLAQDAYTLVTADYATVTTFTDFNDANVLAFLNIKYPTPAANQLAVLTYNYFLSGATASSGTLTTDSFIYINGLWTKAYTVSAAQYTSIGRGVNFYFTATDLTNLPAYLIAFLQNDPSVMVNAKAGDIKYVSYKTSATAIQVFPLTFNGTSWVNNFALTFLKLNGTWVPDPTISIVEPDTPNDPDYVWLRDNTSIGSTAARTNVAQYGDANIESSSQYYWADTDLQAAFAAILLHRVASPVIGIPYRVTYYAYTGTDAAVSKTYVFNGTAFVFQQ